jgi:hypothetical protein
MLRTSSLFCPLPPNLILFLLLKGQHLIKTQRKHLMKKGIYYVDRFSLKNIMLIGAKGIITNETSGKIFFLDRRRLSSSSKVSTHLVSEGNYASFDWLKQFHNHRDQRFLRTSHIC